MTTVRFKESICGSNAPQQQLAQRDFHGAVFDMDGLLLDTERLYRETFLRISLEMGHRISEGAAARMIGYPEAACKKILAEELGSAKPVDAIFANVNAHYHHRITREPIPMRPGAMELITLLKERGTPLALATSTYRAHTDAKLHNVGLSGVFAVTVCGDEVARGKPFPDPYLKAVAGLGLAPQQAFALEDSPTGLKAAHTAGLFTILVPDLVQPGAETLSMADVVAPSLHEVRLGIC